MSESRRNVISGGSTALVSLLSNGNVLKHAYPEAAGRRGSLADIDKEYHIYQKLPNHDRLVRCIRYSPEVGLELEYMPYGTLRASLQQGIAIELQARLQWARDAAEGLSLVHKHDIVHGDVNPNNFLLDVAQRLKIIDFSGSSMAEYAASAAEGVRFYRPRPFEEAPTASTDLFALGSTIYEIMTGKQPYQDCTEDEVTTLFSNMHFPDVQSLHCGDLIMKCWHGDVSSASEVADMVQEQLDALDTEHCFLGASSLYI